MKEFIDRHKINKIYKYSQVQKGDTVEYGWVESGQLDLTQPVVVSYHSQTKKATLKEVEWSKQEKSSATSLSDYRKYFNSLTRQEPEVFIQKWDGAERELDLFWKQHSPNWQEGQGIFMLKLAKLIVEHKKFTMYGRGFKVVTDEGRDSQATISQEDAGSAEASR